MITEDQRREPHDKFYCLCGKFGEIGRAVAKRAGPLKGVRYFCSYECAAKRETYEEALARLTKEYNVQPNESKDLMDALYREARGVLTIQNAPVIEPKTTKKGNHYWPCPTCNRRMSRNFGPRDIEGYASLNCITHGWVGKWKP